MPRVSWSDFQDTYVPNIIEHIEACGLDLMDEKGVAELERHCDRFEIYDGGAPVEVRVYRTRHEADMDTPLGKVVSAAVKAAVDTAFRKPRSTWPLPQVSLRPAILDESQPPMTLGELLAERDRWREDR